jgi:Fe-S oxidoreductase
MSRFPAISNRLLRLPGVNKLLGFHRSRALPKLANQTFSSWFQAHRERLDGDSYPSVVLINDPHTEYYEPAIGIAAVRVLEALGYTIELTPVLSSGRVQISQGLLRSAITRIEEAIDILSPFLEKSTPVVGLEPSELLTFRDEVPDLLSGKQLVLAQRLRDTVMLFEEFIAQVMQGKFEPKDYFVQSQKNVLIHPHCHQRALSSERLCVEIIAKLPGVRATLLPSTCCGMAGAFGYQKSQYELSMDVAEQVLFPAIRAADDNSIVVATGTSCRQQITQGLGVTALHPAELMEQYLY